MKANTNRRIVTWLGIAALTVTLASCGGTDSAAQDSVQQAPARANGPRPLADILVSGPTFPDPGPESVTLLLETSIPVACAAVYGKTTAYGGLATDIDMAGGGHSDHHPLLTGLEPDTEYHVMLQGVGSDGTLYQSGDYTFRTSAAVAKSVGSDPVSARPAATPPAASARPQGDNLALSENGARVSAVSSNYGGGDNDSTYGAGMAIDGSPDTEWSSDGDGDGAWIELRLAGETRVKTIGLRTRTMGSSAQLFAFKVIADGGKSYGPFEVPDASGVHYYATDFTASRLRFEAVTTSGGNTGAVEIEVYGEPEMDPDM
ncbi:MAG: discoidin domain-containing protein [Chloroflexi bacterium]|nr:discoidin domain-containing protein [Chloroflexota bacterium]